MQNIFENLGLQDHTSGMTSIQVKELGTILPDQSSISVLEFGAGVTTAKLYEALCSRYTHVNYVTYEDNPIWAPKIPGIEVRMFTREELIAGNVQISPTEKYDLVIVDGPDGEIRQHWYSVFKDNVNGMFVKVMDSDDITRVLTDIFYNKDKIQDFAFNNLSEAQSLYKSKMYRDKIKSIYS
jgi:hypothetical protein